MVLVQWHRLMLRHSRGKKNEAFLADEELLNNAFKAGQPALDCVAIEVIFSTRPGPVRWFTLIRCQSTTRSYPLICKHQPDLKKIGIIMVAACAFHLFISYGLMLRFGDPKYHVVVLRWVNTKNLEQGDIYITNLASFSVVVYFPDKNWNMAKNIATMCLMFLFHMKHNIVEESMKKLSSGSNKGTNQKIRQYFYNEVSIIDAIILIVEAV